ncbi:MAG: STAS domain-containing protein [Gammaproteobacteria bacterium]|jgi:anti-anti-sigma factor|nr:STAS domain-containing protein [Gammaproteobacteria bacterium]
MEITTREEGDTTVVMLNGKLDTNTTPAAEREINGLLDAGVNKLLINFEQLSYISSSGLRLVLATAKRLKGSAGDIKVCALNEMATEVFELSGFSSIIKVFVTEQDALGS